MNLEKSNASKVSTRFEFFQSGFASEAVLILETVVLNAEFYSLSNGIIFEAGHRAKNATFRQNTNFHQWKKSKKESISCPDSLLKLC